MSVIPFEAFNGAFPYRQYKAGMKYQVQDVEVTKPPQIIIAMGCSIFLPGRFPPMMIGKRASTAVKDVMIIGDIRSIAPLNISSSPNSMCSSVSRISVMADEHDTVAGRNSKNRNKPDHRT